MSGLPGDESGQAPTGDRGRAHPASAPAPAPPAEAAPAAPAPALRDPPPALEANDQRVTAVITAGWAVALVVLLIVRSYLPPGQRWWVWTALAGLGMGLFGLAYVPYLKRSRARKTKRRSRQRS